MTFPGLRRLPLLIQRLACFQESFGDVERGEIARLANEKFEAVS
jgi:hypothetical protein